MRAHGAAGRALLRCSCGASADPSVARPHPRPTGGSSRLPARAPARPPRKRRRQQARWTSGSGHARATAGSGCAARRTCRRAAPAAGRAADGRGLCQLAMALQAHRHCRMAASRATSRPVRACILLQLNWKNCVPPSTLVCSHRALEASVVDQALAPVVLALSFPPVAHLQLRQQVRVGWRWCEYALRAHELEGMHLTGARARRRTARRCRRGSRRCAWLAWTCWTWTSPPRTSRAFCPRSRALRLRQSPPSHAHA